MAVPERGGEKAEVALLLKYWLTCPRPRRTTCKSCLTGGARITYALERIASAKVTIRPRTSSHSAWRDARNPSARVRYSRSEAGRLRLAADRQEESALILDHGRVARQQRRLSNDEYRQLGKALAEARTSYRCHMADDLGGTATR